MSSLTGAPGGEVLLYEAPDGKVRVDVRLDHETVWLTQAQMVDLFGRDQSVVSRHLRNVFADGELMAEGNMQKMHIASVDKPITLYSLDVIISVGYRVKSKRGVQFRQWANCGSSSNAFCESTATRRTSRRKPRRQCWSRRSCCRRCGRWRD
jgi:Virulence protein RhuM family